MCSVEQDHKNISFIVHNIFIGPYHFAGNPEHKQLFNSYNFDVVINVMNDDFTYILNEGDRKIEYYHYPMSDSLDYAKFKPNGLAAANTLYECLKQRKKVYVHCAMGKSRSVAVVLFCLCKHFNFKYLSAKSILKCQRPCKNVNYRFTSYIRRYISKHMSIDNKIGHDFHDKDRFEAIIDQHIMASNGSNVGDDNVGDDECEKPVSIHISSLLDESNM